MSRRATPSRQSPAEGKSRADIKKELRDDSKRLGKIIEILPRLGAQLQGRTKKNPLVVKGEFKVDGEMVSTPAKGYEFTQADVTDFAKKAARYMSHLLTRSSQASKARRSTTSRAPNTMNISYFDKQLIDFYSTQNLGPLVENGKPVPGQTLAENLPSFDTKSSLYRIVSQPQFATLISIVTRVNPEYIKTVSEQVTDKKGKTVTKEKKYWTIPAKQQVKIKNLIIKVINKDFEPKEVKGKGRTEAKIPANLRQTLRGYADEIIASIGKEPVLPETDDEKKYVFNPWLLGFNSFTKLHAAARTQEPITPEIQERIRKEFDLGADVANPAKEANAKQKMVIDAASKYGKAGEAPKGRGRPAAEAKRAPSRAPPAARATSPTREVKRTSPPRAAEKPATPPPATRRVGAAKSLVSRASVVSRGGSPRQSPTSLSPSSTSPGRGSPPGSPRTPSPKGSRSQRGRQQ